MDHRYVIICFISNDTNKINQFGNTVVLSRLIAKFL